MKYFCPLENVKTIKGRSNSEVNGTSTNINGWEIAANGIWAGGKDNNTTGKGKNNLGIFTKNWSIDSEGNVIANGNLNIFGIVNGINFNNYKIIEDIDNNILKIQGKNFNNNYIDALQIERSSGKNSFNLTGANALSANYIKLNGLEIRSERGNELNIRLKDSSYPNLYIKKESYTEFGPMAMAASNDGSKYYNYALPNASGQIMIFDDNARIGQYYYDIKFDKDFPLLIRTKEEGNITSVSIYNLEEDVTIENNELKTINKKEEQEQEMTYSYRPYKTIKTYNADNIEEKESVPITKIKITELQGIINNLDISFNLSTVNNFFKSDYYTRLPDKEGYIKGITIYRYSICGTKDTFKWKRDGTWEKIN